MSTNKTYQQPVWPPTKESLSSPDFLKQRVDAFYKDRVENTWSGGHIMRGRTPDTRAIDISHNDYLSISKHPDVINAQINALLSDGQCQVKGSVFLHGLTLHRQFELGLAELLQAEDVLLCQSGWAANTGLIQSIANETTPVYIDMIAHVSLWEGIHSAKAQTHPVCHNDTAHLEKLIKRYGAGVIVVDSIYSINGDGCPLEVIVNIAEKYGCILVVDESHSLGTYGANGEGMVAALGLADRVHYRTSSLAKAFPGRGGIIACSARHREYFICESRPAIFSSGLLPHDVAAYLAMLKVITQESWRRSKLHHNADYLRYELNKMGYNVEASKAQIIAIESGTEQQTIILRDALEKNHVFGSVFCAPATPKNRAVIRLTINADLTQEQLEHVVKVFYQIRAEVDMQNWPSTLRKARDASRQNQDVIHTMSQLREKTQINKAITQKPADVCQLPWVKSSKKNKTALA